MKLAIAAAVLSCSISMAGQTAQTVQIPVQDSKVQSTIPPAPNMHQQHMQDMKDHIGKMRANVAEMRANAAKIKDPALRHQAQLDADMWEGMVAHMESMQGMMGGPGGMGMMHDGMGMMGGGAGHEMGCCAAMMGHSDHDMAGMKEGSGGACGKMQGGGCCAGMHDGHDMHTPPASEAPKSEEQPK
jgi:hypothetical protein